MMNLDIQRLSDENRYLIDGFSCVETDEMLAGLNAKERRRVRKHSQDMEDFQRNLYQSVVLDYDSPVSMRLWIDEYLAEKSDEITES